MGAAQSDAAEDSDADPVADPQHLEDTEETDSENREAVTPERIDPDGDVAASELELHMERYRWATDRVEPGDMVIDAGCGVGYGTHILAAHARHVIGVDRSEEAIATARARYRAANVRFVCADLSDFRAFPQCDVIVALEVLEHLVEPRRFALAAVTGARRAVLVSTPIVPTVNRNEFHLHDWERRDVETMFLPWLAAEYWEQQSGTYGVWRFEP